MFLVGNRGRRALTGVGHDSQMTTALRPLLDWHCLLAASCFVCCCGIGGSACTVVHEGEGVFVKQGPRSFAATCWVHCCLLPFDQSVCCMGRWAAP